MLCSLARSGETESPAHDRNASTPSLGKYCTIFMHDHPNQAVCVTSGLVLHAVWLGVV